MLARLVFGNSSIHVIKYLSTDTWWVWEVGEQARYLSTNLLWDLVSQLLIYLANKIFVDDIDDSNGV